MLNAVLILVKVMRTPYPNAEDDPWTLDRITTTGRDYEHLRALSGLIALHNSFLEKAKCPPMEGLGIRLTH